MVIDSTLPGDRGEGDDHRNAGPERRMLVCSGCGRPFTGRLVSDGSYIPVGITRCPCDGDTDFLPIDFETTEDADD